MRDIPRGLHAVAVIAIALVTFIGGGIIVASAIVSNFVPWERHHESLAPVSLIGFAVLLLAGILAIARRVRWRWITLSTLVPIALFTFLGFDEPITAPPDMGPRVGNDDPDYRTIMWFGKDSPLSRISELPGAGDALADQEPRLPEDRTTWSEYTQTHKDLIERAWRRIAVGREWIKLLADHPARGVWPYSSGEPILEFRAIRRVGDTTNAYAYLLACEGESDRAVESLVSVIRAMHNLQRTAPGLVNSMIPTVLMKQNLKVVEQILNRGAISERSRLALVEALAKAPPIPNIVRNMFEGEIEFAASVLDKTERTRSALFEGPATDLHLWTNRAYAILGPFLFNRNETYQLVAAPLREVEALSATRNLEALETWEPRPPSPKYQLKNPVGRLLGAMIIPSFKKTAHVIWDYEDLRLALLKRLEK